MEIDDDAAGDLILRTYYMVDWGKVGQSPSEDVCVACGRPMLKVEQVRDKNGMVYGGRVCHGCKVVFWLRDG
jgi:hypothetical protein